jgi:hypothetical protein
MELQQVESLVDGLREPEFADQQWDGTDPAASDAPGFGGGSVVLQRKTILVFPESFANLEDRT